MNRLALGLALAASASVSLYAPRARAESQAEIAEKENDDGKALMFQGNYKGATEKFRDAADRSPEAKYFFNLCYSVYQQGVFGEAMTACNNADKLQPDDALKGKLSKLESQINNDAATQHVALLPTGGGGGPTNLDAGVGSGGAQINTGTGGTQGGAGAGDSGTNTQGGGPVSTGGGAQMQYAVGRPTQNLMAIAPPSHNYTWTLGVDVFGGGGQVGRANFFGSGSAGVRIKSDVMLNSHYKFGGEGYIQYQHFGAGSEASQDGLETLDVFDVGVAVYKHFCGTSRLCFTPLVGVQLALMSPNSETDASGSQVFNYAAIGGRFELSLQYALGLRAEHVISISAGANVYSPVLVSPTDMGTAQDVGLDVGGVAGYVGLGYTYRFNTPLGGGAFLLME